MLNFNDFIKDVKKIQEAKHKKETDECWPEQAGKAKMSEAEMDESGLRMAAHAAHKEGKKQFEFKGKTYPVQVQKEEVEINEGKMKDIYTDMMDHATKKGYSSHKQFTPADYDTVGKQHGISGQELAVLAGHKTAHQANTHFKKPVQKGHEMDRARELAQRGMKSLSKEEVERIEEKLSHMGEPNKLTGQRLRSRGENDDEIERFPKPGHLHPDAHIFVPHKPVQIDRTTGKPIKDVREEADSEHHGKKIETGHNLDKERQAHAREMKEKYGVRTSWSDEGGVTHVQYHGDKDSVKAAENNAKRGHPDYTKEEVQQEMSPYLKATLQVMDEGKIDDLRDAQKLRKDTQSAYDKDYAGKVDTSHPHITTHKGTAYGGEAQKDDEHDEKPETTEKRGRGRPSGTKSGARLKGAGKDTSIDGREYQLHLPNRNK